MQTLAAFVAMMLLVAVILFVMFWIIYTAVRRAIRDERLAQKLEEEQASLPARPNRI